MNEKKEIIKIEDININIIAEINNVRNLFYTLLASLINEKDVNNDRNNKISNVNDKKKNIRDILESLKDKLQEMKANLNYLNNDKELTVSDNLLEFVFKNLYIRINHNFINNDMICLFYNVLYKRKLLTPNLFNHEPKMPKTQDSENSENNDKNELDDNKNKEKRENDINEILKYIENMKSILKNNDFAFLHNDNNNYQILTKYFIFELNNDEKNFFEGEISINVKLKYKNITNLSLLSKIELELSDIKDYFCGRNQNAKNNFFINFMKTFIPYFMKYDQILNSKCSICLKKAKYSIYDKEFIPPYKIAFKENQKHFNKSNKNICFFFHPECAFL